MIHNKPVFIIAALDAAGGIGKGGSIPWFLPAELAYFHTTTSRIHAVGTHNLLIVGRKTWESIPARSHHKFANRLVVVLSRNAQYMPQCADQNVQLSVAHSLEAALARASNHQIGAVYVIGGAEVYGQCIHEHYVDELLLTRLNTAFDCDTFFPQLPTRFPEFTLLGESEESGVHYQFESYTARNGN